MTKKKRFLTPEPDVPSQGPDGQGHPFKQEDGESGDCHGRGKEISWRLLIFLRLLPYFNKQASLFP